MNFQPPDSNDYGHCLNCKRGIERDELRGDYCIECQDLEKADFLALWKGRPKVENGQYTRYFFRLGAPNVNNWVYTNPRNYAPINWEFLL